MFGKKITYKAKKAPRQSLLSSTPKKRIAPKAKFRQYGDKGYKPSNGRGVGY